MSLVPKIGITGIPQIGKTEGLLKIMRRLEGQYTFGGMITRAVEENGRRVGFKMVDWITGEERLLAHVDLDTSYRVGKYNVDIKALEEFGLPAIRKAMESDEVDIVVIDEVGKMELESRKFREMVKEVLESDKPVLLTLHKKSRDSLLQDIRNMNNVRIFEITKVNRNLLPYKIEKILKEEWHP